MSAASCAVDRNLKCGARLSLLPNLPAGVHDHHLVTCWLFECFFSGYLRGVDVIAEASVLITNQAQTFHWAGYGLKLHVPQGALPADLEECRVLVKVGISGQFALPEYTSLVSAVYWLDSEPRCKFLLPLTLEIQHCAMSSHTYKSGCCCVYHFEEISALLTVPSVFLRLLLNLPHTYLQVYLQEWKTMKPPHCNPKGTCT